MSTSNGITRNAVNGNNNKNYIEHQVSKMDTLAGVAIKYGVEVTDIKRLNGLASDLQMFALKTLQIPLPGRHPPSPSLSNGSTSSGENRTEKTLQRLGPSNMLETFQPLRFKSPQQKVSLAMSTLQKYYGLPEPKGAVEGTEMTVYKRNSDPLNDGLLHKAAPISEPHSNPHQKPRNLGNGFWSENSADADYVPLVEAGDGENEKSNEKSVRRRPKAEADSRGGTPEWLLKDEYGSGSSGVSPVTAKGFAMRPKTASRIALATDSDSLWLNSIPVGLGDSLLSDGLAEVRKSSSTPSLQDQDSSNSSVWPVSKWNLKPDLQALSTVAFTRPIFDGLPKPTTSRRSKAALD